MTTKEMIENQLKLQGIKMHKELSGSGLFSSYTYDNRTVYTLEDLWKLNSEGFTVNTDLGAFLFNALIKKHPTKGKES